MLTGTDKEWMAPFEPRPSLRNGHWMTLFGWGNPRYFPRLPPPTPRYFDPAPDARVLAHCHWQPRRWEHPAIVLLHGLNASSQAHYMRGIAMKAFERGFNVVRLNQRNCGGTERLSRGLFHSGLTDDARHVVEELATVDGIRRVVVAGYSLGGNLALKLAGDYGDAPHQAFAGVAAVSPILEISPCVHALERRENWLYEWNFVKELKARMRRRDRYWPGTFDLARLAAIRTVREFDETFTAPHFGFDGAEDYYHRTSAARVIDRVRVPALVITAEDDPFVPAAPFREPTVQRNPWIRTIITAHGGHCGFVGPASGQDDGYWAERQIVQFAEQAQSGAGATF